MPSYSTSLLRSLTIVCSIVAAGEARAQHASPMGVSRMAIAPLPDSPKESQAKAPIDSLPQATRDSLRKAATDSLRKVDTDSLDKTAADSLPRVAVDSLRRLPTDSQRLEQRPSPARVDRCQSSTYRAASRTAAGATFVGAQAVLWSYFENAWWSGEESKGFFFRADWDEDFRDQDKFGHFFGGYHLTRIGAGVLRNACISPGKAIAVSAIYATLFQLQIEIWDARFEKYGFSYPDLIANTAGMAYSVAQHKYPRLQSIKPTISYSRSDAMRARDAGRLPDSEIRESLDYSGQTYWVSAEVDPFLPAAARRYWPDVLRFSVGHSITDWIDPQTGANIRAKRKILLSLDFDASKLPGEHPIWRIVKNTISYIRLPAPALQITPGFDVVGWYR